MKLRSITVEYGETINVGNFESKRITLIAAADLDEGENGKEVAEKIFNNLRAHVQSLVARFISKR